MSGGTMHRKKRDAPHQNDWRRRSDRDRTPNSLVAFVGSSGGVLGGGLVVIAVLFVIVGLVAAAGVAVVSPFVKPLLAPFTTSNTAKDAVGPIVDSIKEAGATVFCELGDPGVGPDNLNPWYDGYFVTSDPDQVREAVFAAATANGYMLAADKGDPSNARPAEAGTFSSNPSGNAYQYNDSPGPAPSLVVSIERGREVSTNCYGSSGETRSISPPSGGAVFEIRLIGTKPAGSQ